MGPSSFIMILIGCAQGGTQCAPIATMPVAFRNQASCLEARADMVAASTDLGYAQVTAECRQQGKTPSAAAAKPLLTA